MKDYTLTKDFQLTSIIALSYLTAIIAFGSYLG